MMSLDHPILLVLALPAWLAYRRWATVKSDRGIFRLGVLACLVIIASGPRTDAPDFGQTLVLVIDRSRSMPPLMDRQVAGLVQQAEAEQGPADRLAVVGFGTKPRVERFPIPNRPPETSVVKIDPENSHLHEAVIAALELIPRGERGRVLVVSDGLADDLLAQEQAELIRSRGVPIDFHYVSRRTIGDVVLQEVRCLTEVDVGADVTFDFDMLASEPSKCLLQISRNGEVLAVRPIELPAGIAHDKWSDRIEAAGVFRYSIQLDVAGDPTPENNRWDVWVHGRGEPKILALNATGKDTPLVEILRRAGLVVEVSRAGEKELSLERLSSFAACVLENVPVNDLGTAATALVRYVEKLGGGLIVTGGDRSFGAGGYRFSSIDPVLPVALRTLNVAERPSQALVVLIEPTAWETPNDWNPDKPVTPLQQALLALTQELDPSDRMGIVTTKLLAPVVLPLSSPLRQKDFRDVITQLGLSSDRGAFPKALAAAWNLLENTSLPAKHLLLCIDTDQYSTWVPPELDPILNRPIPGASITVISWGAMAQGGIGGFARARLPNSRVLATNDPTELAKLFRQDWELQTGGSFVNRPTNVLRFRESATGHPEDSHESLPLVSGFHTATLRDGATAQLIAKEIAGQPLAASWQTQLGRVGAVLFPVEPLQDSATEWNSLGSVLAQQVRWAARLDDRAGPPVVSIDRLDRTAKVEVAASGSGPYPLPSNATLELEVTAADGKEASEVKRFSQEGSSLVARFQLDRAQTYFAVIRNGDSVVARCPPVMLPRSIEFLNIANPESGRAVLAELAQRTGGSEWNGDRSLFDVAVRAYRSLVPFFAWLATAILLIDVADRKHHFTDSLDIAWQQYRARMRTPNPPAVLSGGRETDVYELAKERLRRRLKR